MAARCLSLWRKPNPTGHLGQEALWAGMGRAWWAQREGERRACRQGDGLMLVVDVINRWGPVCISPCTGEEHPASVLR